MVQGETAIFFNNHILLLLKLSYDVNLQPKTFKQVTCISV